MVGSPRTAAPSATSKAPVPPAATGKPPATNTIVDTVGDIVSQPPFQGAVAVALLILICCWLLVHYHDRRKANQ